MESTRGDVMEEAEKCRECARDNISNAIETALEAGMTEKEITEEVEYTLKNYEDES
jgi:DNA-binding transcriptional regulator YhcF (GntR family)